MAAPLDREECHRTALPSCLCKALGHGKEHKFVLGPMSDEDWASHLTDLAHIVEALPYQEADERPGNPWEHGVGLLRDVGERTENDQTGHLLAGGEVDGHAGAQGPPTHNDLAGMAV